VTDTRGDALEAPDPAQAPGAALLAIRVREIRESRRWSQADLSRATGLSRAYIKAIEDGRAKEPSARTIGRLALSLEVHVIDLMQALGALPDDYHRLGIVADLDLTMYLRRQRRLSEEFVSMIMRLIHLAAIDEAEVDRTAS